MRTVFARIADGDEVLRRIRILGMLGVPQWRVGAIPCEMDSWLLRTGRELVYL